MRGDPLREEGSRRASSQADAESPDGRVAPTAGPSGTSLSEDVTTDCRGVSRMSRSGGGGAPSIFKLPSADGDARI